LEIRAKFSLPYRHPVMEGRINCGDCHNPHKGSIMKGGGATNLMGKNDTCFQCHTLQKGPFVFEHEAMREGCVTCHDPHGSVNQKLLVARNQMLCYKCHFQQQAKPAGQTVAGGNGIIYHGNDQHSKDVSQGTCWSAGCHQAIHGSQINQKFLY
jgi:DmsE family decaheme c-type cytochrome